jgi:PAP2 superfamily
MIFPNYGLSPAGYWPDEPINPNNVDWLKDTEDYIATYLWNSKIAEQICQSDLDICADLWGQNLSYPTHIHAHGYHNEVYFIREDRESRYETAFVSRRLARCLLEYIYVPQVNDIETKISNLEAPIEQALVRNRAAIQYLKFRFQRCRPYQAAHVVGRSHNSQSTLSGCSPSIPSGHCWQGLEIFLSLAGSDIFDEKTRPFLAKACVDIGDRRVIAGVHFPSDNIASWYGAIKVYKTRTRSPHFHHLINAVKQSPVWRAVQRSKSHHAAIAQLVQLEPLLA